MEEPIIGIAYSDCAQRDHEMRIRTYVSRKYYHGIQRCGGTALLLPAPYINPFLSKKEKDEQYENWAKKYLSLVDGVLFAGGEDIDPSFFGEDPMELLGASNPFRDPFEIALCRKAYEQRKSILGICRGMQLMAVALGGSVYQDIGEVTKLKHSQSAPRWQPSHKVTIKANSVLYKMAESGSAYVNSFHHQAVKNIPDGFDVTAKTSDGIIEAIESYRDNSLFMGVQWHPDETFNTDRFSRNIFKGFVEACCK